MKYSNQIWYQQQRDLVKTELQIIKIQNLKKQLQKKINYLQGRMCELETAMAFLEQEYQSLIESEEFYNGI